ncbi:unnamed protein product [Adineta ricciae]|uniref:Uncharacterized protein n=2 Tax=Adineta ricciae TaxID=249248 RepID=A0A815C6N1_ADIRI|nr:unnamed protein product [Adineta ricciae]
MSERLTLRWLYNKLIRGNLFDSRSSDPVIIHREILSTRLYILFLIISLVILTTYTSLYNQIESKTVTFPSASIYQKLEKKYSNSLQCLCTKVSIPYGEFVTTTPKFHQICSSDFISQKWIDFIFQINVKSTLPIDVRTSLSSMFQLIRSFCQSATHTTIHSLDSFHHSPVISPILLTKHILETKVRTTLHLLHQTTASNFLQSMTLAQKMTQANQLITALFTNYMITSKIIPSLSGENLIFDTNIHENKYIRKNSTVICSCQNHDSCHLPGYIYLNGNYHKTYEIFDLNQLEANETLSGIIVDCLPIQTTLYSSLECFYNQLCLNILLASYQKKINISRLNSFLTSRFHLKTPIKSLVEELFIEELFNHTNFSTYYMKCLPYVCTYLHFNRFNWISVLTVMFALFGGINTVLRLITPYIIRTVLFLIKPKQVRENRNTTIRVRLKKLVFVFKMQLISLNIYDSNVNNPTHIYYGRLATRLHLISLFISICICILFSDLSNQIITENVSTVSLDTYAYLEKQYSSTLRCLCTQISIPYEDFINISVNYHQICSSEFIQSSWYERLSVFNNNYEQTDFLSISSSYFQTLETFCFIANETIADARKRFLARNFINSQLLTRQFFDSQINASINAFQQLTKTEFRYRINLTNTLLHSNQYISRTTTSTRLIAASHYKNDTFESIRMFVLALYAINTNNDRCYCAMNSTCSLDYALLNFDIAQHFNWQIPGIHGGCSIINTVMKSSLICWFNYSCFSQLRELVRPLGISIPWNTTLLDQLLPSRYSPDTLIEIILNEIMIEEWNSSYSFDKFYSKCQPSSCSFTYEKQVNIIYIVTIVISLIGGINTILRLTSPLIIKIILKIISTIKYHKEEHQQNPRIQSNNNITHRLVNKLISLNIFDDGSDDPERIHRQRISTRLYIVGFTVAIYFISVYTIFMSRSEFQFFSNPSENDYNELLASYSDSLKCPCRKTSIEYKSFLKIDTKPHSVCSSDFVHRRWIEYLFNTFHWYSYDRRDIRTRGGAYFVFLSTLCQISQKTIDNAKEQFLDTSFVNTHMISQLDFDIQINNTISQFQNDTLIKFSQSLKFLRDIINGNALISSYSLNWDWFRETNSSYRISSVQPVRTMSGCSCGTQNDCTDQAGIFDTVSNSIPRFFFPGWYVGCSVVETLLRSTLQCFYDQHCLNLFFSKMKTFAWEYSTEINISVINYTSHFHRNAIIEKLVNELFIEQWIIQKSYSLFYNQSLPYECIYQIEKEDYLIHTMSTILGLYGGLTIILRFITPILIDIVFYLRQRCRTNTVIPY